MITCRICNHEQRYDIESALYDISESSTTREHELSLIADTYNISLNELKVHALMHIEIRPAVSADHELPRNPRGVAAQPIEDEDTEPLINNYCDNRAAIIVNDDGTTSLATQMKLREADMLLAVANEYLTTLKTIGKKINGIANKANNDEIDSDIAFTRLITKPMVDLYIGAGSEIRATIKTLADVNQIINGKEEDQSSAGLRALAEALSASKPDLPQTSTLNFVNIDKEGMERTTSFIVDPKSCEEDGV